MTAIRSCGHWSARFGQSFAVIDCANGHVVRPAADGLAVDLYKRLASCEQIVQRGRPEIVDEVSPLLLMAVPLPTNPTEPVLVGDRHVRYRAGRMRIANRGGRPRIRQRCRPGVSLGPNASHLDPHAIQEVERGSRRKDGDAAVDRYNSSGSWPIFRRTC